jgi:N-acetylmuramoyl-L-alanine amidase
MLHRFRKPARPTLTQREAILSRIYEDNLRLREPGWCPRAARRPYRRKRHIGAAVPLFLLAVAGAGYELLPAIPMQQAASVERPPAPAAMPYAVALPTVPVAGVEAAKKVARTMPDAADFASGVSESTSEMQAPEQTIGDDQPTLRQLFGLAVKTIVIDAGHGGHDPGAIGKTTGIREKDVTLDIARRLKDKLDRDGRYRVLLVRDDDTFVALNRRAAFANARETDLFVSLHVNYVAGTSSNAIETYYFGQYQDIRSRALAQRENRYSSYAISEFQELLKGMQNSVKLDESKRLATAIQRRLLENVRQHDPAVLDTGVKTAPFAVLLGVEAPSILAEVSNLSSPEAERNLASARYRNAVATYIASGIHDYLHHQPQEVERHVKVEDGIARH